MFQRYTQNIDPENPHFIAFISRYLAERKVTNPRAVPYFELYEHIKEGIREYLRQPESERKQNRMDTKSQ
jgi:hypothetical protein